MAIAAAHDMRYSIGSANIRRESSRSVGVRIVLDKIIGAVPFGGSNSDIIKIADLLF